MSSLQYVGRNPDSDAIVLPKVYSDTTAAAGRVDNAYITAQVNIQIAANSLQAPSYVDTQDALRAHKTAVDAADATYFATTALNAANGLAGLDVGGDLIVGQIPAGIRTDRVITAVTGTNILSSGSIQKAFTTNVRETAVSTLTVADPGYPWRPLPFALIQGASIDGSTPATRSLGNSIVGLATVMSPAGISDTVYATGVCTASPHWNFYSVLPYGASGQTPASVPAITGSRQLDLYVSCFSGSGYSFKGEGLAYWVLCVPAVGS